MTTAARLRYAVLAVVVLAHLTFIAAEGWSSPLALGWGAITLTAAVVGWMVTEGKPGRGLPRWLVGLMLAGVVAWAVFEVRASGFTVSPFNGFLASIVAIKLWERRRPRDYAQILSIALFLNIGSILTSNTMPVGALLIAGVPVYVYAVMLLQLHLAAERVREQAGDDGFARPTPSSARPLAALAAWSVVLGLVISVAVFIAVPRGIGPRAWGDWGVPIGGRVTAFTNAIELGQAGLISQSQSVVMEVQLARGGGVPMWGGPLENALYLRGAVLTRYHAGRWEPAGAGAGGLSARVVDVAPVDDRDAASVELMISQRAMATSPRILFAPWRAVGAVVERGPRAVARDATTDVLFVRDAAGPIRYRVFCTPGTRATEPDYRRSHAVFPSERIATLATRVLDEGGIAASPISRPIADDLRAARALEAFLRSRFTYSLDVRAPDGSEDPIEWFLFTARQGHCEYFASALAAMARSVGIESRVVTGYLASEFDEATATYTVRESDAHAWVEVRVGADDWRTLDGTPSAGFAEITQPRRGIGAALRRALDRLEDAWSTGVVNFDQGGRGRLVADWSGGWLGGTLGTLRRVTARFGVLGGTFLIAAAVTVVVGVLAWGVVAFARWVVRRRSRTPAGPAVDGPEGALYRLVLARLDAAGLGKPAWRGGLEHLRIVARDRPELDAALRPVVHLCYAAWFAGRRASPAELREARERVAGLSVGG